MKTPQKQELLNNNVPPNVLEKRLKEELTSLGLLDQLEVSYYIKIITNCTITSERYQ